MPKFKPERRTCKNCDQPYAAMRHWQRFCSGACRIAYWRKTHPQLSAEELKEIKQRLGIRDETNY